LARRRLAVCGTDKKMRDALWSTWIAGTLKACRVVIMRDTNTLKRSASTSRVVRSPSTPKLRSGASMADCSAAMTRAMSMV
jgi:hypothetical protein